MTLLFDDGRVGETERGGREESSRQEEERFDAERESDASSASARSEIEEPKEEISAGVYRDYSDTAVARSLEEERDVVLFFHAIWCPTCKNLDRRLKEATIPNGVSIFKVDFDSEKELKRRYGVRSKHTLIQIDSEREPINIWFGSPSAESVFDNIQ